MYRNISVKELKTKIENKEDFILLDARTDPEFQQGHIKNAILIPYDEIAERHEELKADKDSKIVVYCRSGNRSEVASEILTKLGYTNVENVTGGINEWEDYGYELSE